MNRRAFTLLELLVVIAIITIIAAIVYPVLTLAKEAGRKSTCMNNVRSVSQAMQQYIGDNTNRLPLWTINGEWQWDQALFGYVKNEQVFSCPKNTAKVRPPGNMIIRAYALPKNVSGISLNEIPRPTLTVMLFEKGAQPVFSWGDATGETFYQMWDVDYDPSLYPHEKQKVFSFIDGHAAFFRLKTGPFQYWFDSDKYPKGYCGNKGGLDISNDSVPGANLPR